MLLCVVVGIFVIHVMGRLIPVISWTRSPAALKKNGAGIMTWVWCGEQGANQELDG